MSKKKIRALTTAGALVLAGAFGTAVVLTCGSGNGATLGLFLAGGAILLILTGVIALYAKHSDSRDKARCNYCVGDVYQEVLPSTGHEDLYRMYMELQQRITVLEEDYYNRLAQQRRAREEMINRRRPVPMPGVRKENQDNQAGTR